MVVKQDCSPFAGISGGFALPAMSVDESLFEMKTLFFPTRKNKPARFPQKAGNEPVFLVVSQRHVCMY